jgi:hypothetical protein
VIVFAAVTAYLQPRFADIGANKPTTKDESSGTRLGLSLAIWSRLLPQSLTR